MQKKSAWLLSGVLALLTLPHTAQADAIGDNNICYAQFATGNYGSAIDYCSRAIGSGELGEGDLVAALINRGVAYKSSGDLLSAVADYTRALELAPDDALLYQNRANALREMGDLEAALVDIEKSLEFAPEVAGAWYVRGAIAEAQGDRQAARRFYMSALGLDPENEAYKAKLLSGDAP
jgi:tetratricopeptide (TPR) repeat protein